MRWLKHMTNARNDEALSEMVELYGAESYGIWWFILELIGAQMDKTDKCSVRYSIKKWAKSCRVSAKKFQKVASFLSEVGKISIEKCEKTPDFWKIECRNLLIIRDEYSKKSRHTPDNIPPVSGATPDQDTDTEADTEADIEKTRVLFDSAFEKWWQTYPKRNGRRIGKKDAKVKFLKITKVKWNNLKTATANYCDYLEKSGLSAMDAHRFLTDKWIDYIENVEHSENKPPKGRPESKSLMETIFNKQPNSDNDVEVTDYEIT